MKFSHAFAVWLVAVLGYVLAVMQRTSFGIAGLEASKRFSIGPAELSWFVFLQVAVYIAAQIPSGVLVGRWGARSSLLLGGLLVGAGQMWLALAKDLQVAVFARVLVGAGDALIFVAVLAVIPRWFAPKRVPLITQLTGMLGQLGQILSAVPFFSLLQMRGWTVAFATIALASSSVAILSFIVVRNSPKACSLAPEPSHAAIASQLRTVWRRPGTMLAFFSHMGTQSSMMVFTLLWGFPYLVAGQELSPTAAGGLISLLAVSSVAVGLLVGLLSTRHSQYRPRFVLAIIGLTAAAWTAVLVVPSPAPRWLLVLLVVVLSAGGPGSLIAFDIARTSNPEDSLSVAQSIVNLGGFSATLLSLTVIGALLDMLGGYTPTAFRLAWLIQYAVWFVAGFGILMTGRRMRDLASSR